MGGFYEGTNSANDLWGNVYQYIKVKNLPQV